MLERSSQPQTADDRERDLFHEALDLPEGERSAFLVRACAGNAVLNAAVESLLQNHKQDAFLETPASRLPVATALTRHRTLFSGPVEKLGDWIGRYRILRKIGEGGCGIVYLSEQVEPVRRRVALKVIKLGMDTKQVIARFDAERQALALMDHPNIARVLDAGSTESGRPYFVMELVEGVRLTTYCDENHLTTEERLNLFVQVCHAIQHAHQKGVIHRDIKPSNILVTVRDPDRIGIPKVIDFGIAKAIQEPLTDKTLFTQFHTFLGTPAYTSPEQAELSPDASGDIDTRSDIYSLGVLLYELLTGRPPFDPELLMRADLVEMQRIIREDEALKPSTRIGGLGMAEALAFTGARGTKMPALVQALRGDLDWIVMKCLEKDRSRRYDTVNALVLDIKRYLEDEPVLARRPSSAYRLQKFVRRNRVVVSASVVVAVALMVGILVSSWSAIRATQAEHEQSRLRRTVEAALKKEARLREEAQAERLAALRRAYDSDMNLVQQALTANNYGRVMDLLNRHRLETSSIIHGHSFLAADLRQWEWRYFWAQARSEAEFALPQQDGPILGLVVSPNGRLMVSSSREAVKLWDLKTRDELAVILKNGGAGPLAFAHDGSQLALVSNSGPDASRVKIWAIARREFTSELSLPEPAEAAAFTLDDRQLVTLGRGHHIRHWDVDLNTMTADVQAPGRGGTGRAEFSPDAQLLAVVDGNRIRILDTTTGQQQSATDHLQWGIHSMAFSPDCKLLAVGPSFSGTNTAIHLFLASTGQEVGELVGHVSWVPDLTFTSDSQRLVSVGADQTLRVWDIPSRQRLAALRGHLSEIYRVAVSADGKTAVSGCKDGTLFGWDCEHCTQTQPFKILSDRVQSVAFFPDSSHLLSLNYDGTLGVWDSASLQEIEKISGLGWRPNRVLLSPDTARVYVGSPDGRLTVLDWATRLVITNLWLNSNAAAPLRPGRESGPIGFLDAGHTLVVETAGPTIQLLDTTCWEPKGSWSVTDAPDFLPARMPPLLSSSGHFLVFRGRQGTAEFRDPRTGAVKQKLSIQRQRVSAMALAPDDSLFATSSVDGTVDLWDCAQQQMVDVLRGHLLGIEAVTFAPDGQRLATTSHGSEAVKLWDVATRHEVATLSGEGSLFAQVQFSPDGQLLVAINIQGQAHVWRAPTLVEIESSER
jgi:WD40 repeat protein/serine/threonine protein kinase